MAITLSTIRDAADKKYGSYDIVLDDPENPVRLLNPLRLSDEARAELKAVQAKLSASSEDEDADQAALFQEALLVVAASKAEGQALVDAVGRDLAVLAEIFAGYGDNTQVGEA